MVPLLFLLLLATPASVQCLASSAGRGRPRTVFDPEISASALAKYNSGAYSTTGLAREFDMSYRLMRRMLLEAGADLKPIKTRNETALVPPDIIARGLAGGYSCVAIAKREKLNYYAVLKEVKTNQTLADMKKGQRRAVEELALAKGEELAREAESAYEALKRKAQESRAILASKMKRRRQLAMRLESSAPSQDKQQEDMVMVRLRQSGLTLQAIGDRFGISRERVRQRLGRCNLSGPLPNRPDEAELHALGCIFEAVPDPEVFIYTSEDSGVAFVEACKVAESFGLSVRGLETRLKHLGSMRRRKERFLLKLNSFIALEIARGKSCSEIAGAVGVNSETVRNYAEDMGLHRKRERLKGFTREDYESGHHPFDAEIDARTASGESRDSIAWELGLSNTYVARRARRGTVKAESQQDQLLCKLASNGLGTAAIAAKTGKSRSWVSNRAALLGVRLTRQPYGHRKASAK